MTDLDFPNLIKNAMRFDESLSYARKKLLDASKLGMGKNAFPVMSDIKNELEHLLRSVEAISHEREEENKRLSDETLAMFEFIESASKELDSLENLAAEQGSYIPFQHKSLPDRSCNMQSPLVSNEHGKSMTPRRIMDFDGSNSE